MATISFTRDIEIKNKETIERLERGALTAKPLNISSRNAVAEMKRSEEKLLHLLRSKHC